MPGCGGRGSHRAQHYSRIRVPRPGAAVIAFADVAQRLGCITDGFIARIHAGNIRAGHKKFPYRYSARVTVERTPRTLSSPPSAWIWRLTISSSEMSSRVEADAAADRARRQILRCIRIVDSYCCMVVSDLGGRGVTCRGVGNCERSHPPPSASTSATADVISCTWRLFRTCASARTVVWAMSTSI
jgi:hypothetical protein